MKAVIAISEHGGYEVGDVLIVVPSDYQFYGHDLRTGVREAVEVGTLLEDDQVLLRMESERIRSSWAIASIPAFRHHAFRKYNMVRVKRRKYTLDANYELVKK